MPLINPKCPYCGSNEPEKKQGSTSSKPESADNQSFVINPLVFLTVGFFLIALLHFGGSAVRSAMETNKAGSSETIGMAIIFVEVSAFALLLAFFPIVRRNFKNFKKRFGKTYYCPACESYFKG